jgi:hypothetical protein
MDLRPELSPAGVTGSGANADGFLWCGSVPASASTVTAANFRSSEIAALQRRRFRPALRLLRAALDQVGEREPSVRRCLSNGAATAERRLRNTLAASRERGTVWVFPLWSPTISLRFCEFAIGMSGELSAGGRATSSPYTISWPTGEKSGGWFSATAGSLPKWGRRGRAHS